MVDNINPNSQFHPYQPMDKIPEAEVVSGGLGGMLKKMGAGVDVRPSLDKVRGMARSNPSIVLGGLAALAIGMGLMRRR